MGCCCSWLSQKESFANSTYKLERENMKRKYFGKDKVSQNKSTDTANSNILIDSMKEETKKWNWTSYVEEIDGEAFKIVEKYTHLPFKIIKVEKIVNDLNFIEYFASKTCVSLKNSDDSIEEIGFYGSSSIDPNRMCTEKLGFNFRELKGESFGKAFHLYEDACYLHAKKKCYREPINKNICKIILAKQIVGQTWDSKEEKCESLKMPPKIPGKQDFLDRYDSVTGYTETKRKITVTYENYTILPLFIITYDETKPKTDMNAQWFYGENNVFDSELNNQIEINFLSGLVTFPITIGLISYLVNLKDLTVISNNNICYEIIRRVFRENIGRSCFYTPLEFDLLCVDEKINNSEIALSDTIKNEIMQNLMNIFKLKSSNNKTSIKVIDLEVKSKEYREAYTFFHKNYKADPKRIRKIEKIVNPFILIKYFVQKVLLALKSNCTDEKLLFHGTRETEPKMIYSDTVGFDMRYSREGMWGKANYFAVNSSYSDAYCYKIPNTWLKQIFISKVLIGDSKKVMPSDSSLIKPPAYQKNGKHIQYDSVNGETNGSVVYMIYENSRAYPEYLVTYE